MMSSSKTTLGQREPDPMEALSLRSVVDMLWRRKYALVVPIVLCGGLAAIWTSQLPPRYQARALMMLDSPRSEGRIDPRGTVRAQLGSIRETLNRRSLLETVIVELGLYESVDGQVAEADLEEMRKRLEIGVEGDQTFHLVFADHDAERAANTVNRIGELLVHETDSARTYQAQMLVELIASEVQTAEEDLFGKQQALETRRSNADAPLSANLDLFLGSLSTTTTRLQETNRSIADAQARRARTEAVMRQIDQLGSQPRSSSSVLVADPRRTELQGQLDRALERGYTAEHPTVARLMSELAALDSDEGGEGPISSLGGPAGDLQMRYIQLQADLEGIDSELDFLREEKRSLIEAISQYQQRADSDSQQERAMATLLREYELTRTRYLDLLDRLDDARFQASLEGAGAVSGMQVAEAARVPTGPTGPQWTRFVGLGVLMGLGMGLASVLALHQLDTSFTDITDLAGATNLSVLAAVPSIRRRFFARKKSRLPTLSERTSVASEQYRILASRLRHEMDRECAQLLLITSGAGGEGKTTTAINVAVALSQIQDERVLLLDADLRRPHAREYLTDVFDGNLGTDDGFLDLVSGSPELPSELFGKVERLHVLVGSTRSNDSLSAIASDSAKAVLARLRKHFKYIIIDAPPVLPMVDSHLLSELSDKVLMVVRARSTRRETLARTLESFDVSRVLGLVLNDVDFNSARYGPAYAKYVKDYLPKERWSTRIRIL